MILLGQQITGIFKSSQKKNKKNIHRRLSSFNRPSKLGKHCANEPRAYTDPEIWRFLGLRFLSPAQQWQPLGWNPPAKNGINVDLYIVVTVNWAFWRCIQQKNHGFSDENHCDRNKNKQETPTTPTPTAT